MRFSLLLFSLVVLLAGPVLASEAGDVRPNLALPDRTNTFVDKTYGFQIDVPRHFELTGDEAGLLYFQSSQKPGLIIIRPTPGMGLKNVQQLMRNGFESPITSLRTDGSPLTLGVRNGQVITAVIEYQDGYYFFGSGPVYEPVFSTLVLVAIIAPSESVRLATPSR